MGVYYIGGINYDSNYLQHHGVKGQKWGIRRYQNEDGSLTDEGQKRYGNGLGKYANSNGLIRRVSSGDYIFGTKRAFDKGEATLKKTAKDLRDVGATNSAKSTEKYAKQLERSNIARDKYLSNTSTGKLVAQNLLLSPIGGRTYREFRSQDNSRGKAALKTIGSMMVPFGVIWAPEVGKKHKFG